MTLMERNVPKNAFVGTDILITIDLISMLG